MNLILVLILSGMIRIPRVSGDEPVQISGLNPSTQYSPRERG